MKVNICPHCHEIVDLSWKPISGIKKDDDLFWCNFCGKISFYCDNGESIKKPDPELLQELYEKDDDRLDSPDWLPECKKEDLKFRIYIVENGIFNLPHYNFEFYETERLLKLMYHQLGYFPLIGDEIRGIKRKKPGETIEEEAFVIVGRQIVEDDYDTIGLFVVPEERWHKKMGW